MYLYLYMYVYIGNIDNSNHTPDLARVFRQGEVIHLFSNQDKIDPNDNGGVSLLFDNLKLTFQVEKNSQIISLAVDDYKSFIAERKHLSSLAAFMKLKMSELVANNIYFEGISSNKVNMFGPLLSLKRYVANDILFKSGHSGTSSGTHGTGPTVTQSSGTKRNQSSKDIVGGIPGEHMYYM